MKKFALSISFVIKRYIISNSPRMYVIWWNSIWLIKYIKSSIEGRMSSNKTTVNDICWIYPSSGIQTELKLIRIQYNILDIHQFKIKLNSIRIYTECCFSIRDKLLINGFNDMISKLKRFMHKWKYFIVPIYCRYIDKDFHPAIVNFNEFDGYLYY